MKFVYFGYDFMLGSVQRLLEDGHELIGVFTFPCDNVFNFNAQTVGLAEYLKIPVITEPPKPSDIAAYIQKGCACFLSAGYPFKIPPIDETKSRGINVHPSLLPLGRGLMPTPHILLNHPKASGLTVHKLTPGFDEGDILHQTPLPLHERETVETLSARIALRAPDVLSMIFSDLPSYWSDARPQNEKKATYFPPPDDSMRLLEWTLPVKRLDEIARAFGRYGSLARFDNELWVVYAHDIWQEKHGLKPGTVAIRLPREIVIAAKDGFVCLKEFHKARMA
jgi:methionyl-tRNA formyltransferase